MNIAIDKIKPNQNQPRTNFDKGKLKDLAASIKEHGVLQPIAVRKINGTGEYELVDGERRLRASGIAGLKEIPAYIRNTDDSNMLIEAVVANLQRDDLNPIEEAKAFAEIYERLGTHIKTANSLGVNTARIKSRMYLLELDEPIQDLIASGRLQKDKRMVDALLSIPDSSVRIKIAKGMAYPGVTISMIEAACRKALEKMGESNKGKGNEPPSINYAEQKAGPRPVPIWNRMLKKNRVPPWGIVQGAAIASCKKCSFFDYPSDKICGECPVVDFIIDMVEGTRNG